MKQARNFLVKRWLSSSWLLQYVLFSKCLKGNFEDTNRIWRRDQSSKEQRQLVSMEQRKSKRRCNEMRRWEVTKGLSNRLQALCLQLILKQRSFQLSRKTLNRQNILNLELCLHCSLYYNWRILVVVLLPRLKCISGVIWRPAKSSLTRCKTFLQQCDHWIVSTFKCYTWAFYVQLMAIPSPKKM